MVMLLSLFGAGVTALIVGVLSQDTGNSFRGK